MLVITSIVVPLHHRPRGPRDGAADADTMTANCRGRLAICRPGAGLLGPEQVAIRIVEGIASVVITPADPGIVGALRCAGIRFVVRGHGPMTTWTARFHERPREAAA